jgi:hypothetical protein
MLAAKNGSTPETSGRSYLCAVEWCASLAKALKRESGAKPVQFPLL